MSSIYEQQYLELCRKVLNEGTWVLNERTGVKCLTIPRHVMEYTLDEKSIPLLTTRPSYPVSAIAEIIGYLRRYEWAQQFDSIGTKSWHKNADETFAWVASEHRKGKGHVGKVYGAALSEEYIHNTLQKIQDGKDDRGLKFDWWQPEMFEYGCLRPCLSDHQIQFLGDKTYLTSVQRSCDLLVGGNFNSLQVYFLGMMSAHLSGNKGGNAIHVMNNVHIYEPHLEGLEELLSRKPKPLDVEFKISGSCEYWQDLVLNDNHARDYFKLEGYKGIAQPKIDFEMIA